MKTHMLPVAPIESENSIVISGISGKYPRSNSVEEFAKNLYAKVDLVDDEEDRWDHTHPDIPKRQGKLKSLGKFDADYFGCNLKEAHTMDPQHRLLLEHCHEAILDAGLHLDDLRGSRTGVFVGISISETEAHWTYKKESFPYKKFLLGFSKSMSALKIAYALDLKGPVLALDTACSSSMYALDRACKAIRQGQCDAALVAGTNLTLHPYITLQFALLGVLAADGFCRPFDKNASGYSRSEANAVILLQKAKDSKRIYAHVVNTKTNCDGYKLEGITFPSNKIQKQLLDELYSEVPYDPKDVSYVEAHSTGTVVGDPEECDAIDKVFCPGRTEPLLVGSVKSNIGHSEAAAGICSVTKCVIAMQNWLIPPNINFTEPRTDVPSLLNGNLKVVDNPTPLGGPLVAVNSFGFGGANAHALLHASTKRKALIDIPSDDLPRLVVWSGRTVDAVDYFLDGLGRQKFDIELYALTHNIQRKPLAKMAARGYSIFAPANDGSTVLVQKNVAKAKKSVPKFTLVFGQMDYDWEVTVRAFEQFPQFKATYEQCKQLLKAPEYAGIFSTGFQSNTLHRAVWTLVLQISIHSVLKAIGLKVDNYGGYSIGQITCAYIDGVITLPDAIRIAFTHGALLVSYNNPETFNYREIIMDKSLNTKLATVLQSFPMAKPSNRWINATSVLSFRIYDPKCSNQLFNSIESDVIVLQPLPTIQSTDNILKSFLGTIGRAFINGQHCNLLHLYPTVTFPVSLETPMISSLIRWDHSRDWHVSIFRTNRMVKQGNNHHTVSLVEQEYIAGHCIDGRILIPATQYLHFVWDTLASKTGIVTYEVAVEFKEVEFLRATTLTTGQAVSLSVEIHQASGYFEVTEGSVIVVKGYVQPLEKHEPKPIERKNTQAVVLSTKDFYKELRLRGYHYGGVFKSIIESTSDGTCAKIEWKENWTALLDCMLQVAIVSFDTRSLMIPTRIDSIKIDPMQQKTSQKHNDVGVPYYNVYFDPDLNLLQCGAIEIRGLNASTIARRLPPGVPVLESYRFLPYYPQEILQPADVASIIVQTILENQATIFFNVTEIHSPTRAPIISLFGDAIGDLPLVKAQLTLISTGKPEPIPNVIISEDKLMKQRNVLLLICENLFTDDEFISDAINCLADQGFILLRETQEYTLTEGHRRLQLVSTFFIEDEKFLLYQQKKSSLSSTVDAHVIKVSSNDSTLSWLLELKDEVKNKPIILYAQNDPTSGIIGLVNCIRKEPNIQNVTCFFIDDSSAPPFDPTHPFYKNQVELGLAVNVYRNGQWGLYRHFKLHEQRFNESVTKHCFANCVKPGDLSSFTWMEGPLKERPLSDHGIKIAYSSLNFRDVMLATGRLTIETFCTDRLAQECVLGLEFSGVTATGKRVMGIVPAGSMATVIEADPRFILDVPDEYTLEQAASIPTVYATVYAAFFVCADIRKGKSILIHAGTGGIGLAAIRVAQAYGLEVFTTVSTKEKREFLLSYFPDLNSNNIGNSRDTTFERLIKERTNGRDDVASVPISYLPRVYCSPEKSMVIAGGLGGFGLELADWLIIRGCRKVLLSSSRGITKPYQQYRINTWKSYGVQVRISTEDISTENGCRRLLLQANEMGPVAGIFNLAVQLRDAIMENQSVDKFAECLAPKATATQHFDVISQELCPMLKHFVVFSSVSCGRGNAGQSNYATEVINKQLQLEDLLASFGDEAASHHTVLRLPSKSDDLQYERAVLIIPGIESVCSPPWVKIASDINAPTFILQSFANSADEQTVSGIVDSVFDEMFQTVFAKCEQFLVIGYSFGSLLALDIVKRLEARSLRGKLMLIDGSPLYLQRFASNHFSVLEDEQLQIAVLTLVLSFLLPTTTQEKIGTIMGQGTFAERITKTMEIARDSNPFSEEYSRKMLQVLFNRIKAAMNATVEAKAKLRSALVLVRSGMIRDIEEDYGLKEFTTSSMIVKIIDGTHQTILANPELIEIINKDTL
ncbi:fatty acid synthase S-acetyltransferase [Anopheles sinensis]|uniref:Fatty acid synthase S-acetyltransferase n=1 Tax=Anopheles sinensis TaxID=74873 RepID=A0A084W1V8_ANOSI|nr:fatty acid synthase S-acetyltransferase [Anopheles sinensis]